MQCLPLDLAVWFYCILMAILALVCSDPCWDLQGYVSKKVRSISLPAARGGEVWAQFCFLQCLVKVLALVLSDTRISLHWRPYLGSAMAEPASLSQPWRKLKLLWVVVLMPTITGRTAPCTHHTCRQHLPRRSSRQRGAPLPKCTCRICFWWALPLPCPTTPMGGREALRGMPAAQGSERTLVWTAFGRYVLNLRFYVVSPATNLLHQKKHVARVLSSDPEEEPVLWSHDSLRSAEQPGEEGTALAVGLFWTLLLCDFQRGHCSVLCIICSRFSAKENDI